MIDAPEKRVAGKLPFDLIAKSTPELLYFPFCEKTWHPFAYYGRTDAKKLAAIKSVNNDNHRLLPANTNLLQEVTYYLEQNFNWHDSFMQIWNEQLFFSNINNVKDMVRQKTPINFRHLYFFMKLADMNMFLSNMEIFTNNEYSPKSGQLQIKDLSKLNKALIPVYRGGYEEDAYSVCQRGELCFQRENVFKQTDHNVLTREEHNYFYNKLLGKKER